MRQELLLSTLYISSRALGDLPASFRRLITFRWVAAWPEAVKWSTCMYKYKLGEKHPIAALHQRIIVASTAW